MSNEKMIRERPGTTQRKQDLLERIGTYVEANLHRRVTLQEISGEFKVSVSTVTQLFQKRANTTFHQYLTHCRMEAAQELIRSGVPLEEVGRQVGYTDHSSFYRAFRQTFGVSPREFKQGKQEI